MSRRAFLRTAAALAASISPPVCKSVLTQAAQPKRVIEILATANANGTEVYFDPIGIRIEPGTTVRWILERLYHSTTAYHPKNANHEQRIPENADPWDSGLLLEPGVSTFEATLTIPGVYDYYCTPHEYAGMVGRIVVGEPSGPGALPFDHDPSKRWNSVPQAARERFPSINRIVEEGIVRAVPAG